MELSLNLLVVLALLEHELLALDALPHVGNVVCTSAMPACQ
jgi:hypothetical protein